MKAYFENYVEQLPNGEHQWTARLYTPNPEYDPKVPQEKQKAPAYLVKTEVGSKQLRAEARQEGVRTGQAMLDAYNQEQVATTEGE